MNTETKTLPFRTSCAISSPLNRRQFVARCATCLSCAALPLFRARATGAANSGTARPRIRLVFCETRNDQPIWPNVGYDFAARRNRISQLLKEACPDLDWLPAQLMDEAKQAKELVESDKGVDGYLVCVQGLGWNNDVVTLSSTGKPTLLVDNLFGGSGVFLRDVTRLVSSGHPVDWVSSSRDQDIVESARQFARLAKGESFAEIASAFRDTRRKNTPAVNDWSCTGDPVKTVDLDKALEQLRRTRILVVGGGWGGDDFRKASRAVTGVEFVPITFEEMAAAYEQADRRPARQFAERWKEQAQKREVVSDEVLDKSGAMYVAMEKLMEKHQARGISINCLGGFYGGHLKAYPCLGFSEFNNTGRVGGCEADQMSALTMTVMGALTGRPGYISDPVIDTSKSAIVYAHCVATTKPFGADGIANPYQILTHSEDRQGAAIRSLLPVGYLTTTLELNPVTRQVLLHQAKTIDNNASDMACRTKLEAVVKGDLEKLTEHWSMGWHRVTFYGDLLPQVQELCSRLKLQLIQEA